MMPEEECQKSGLVSSSSEEAPRRCFHTRGPVVPDLNDTVSNALIWIIKQLLLNAVLLQHVPKSPCSSQPVNLSSQLEPLDLSQPKMTSSSYLPFHDVEDQSLVKQESSQLQQPELQQPQSPVSVSGSLNASTTDLSSTQKTREPQWLPEYSKVQHSGSGCVLPKKLWKPKSFDFNDFFQSQVKRYTANDVCYARCQMLYKDHYHCYAEEGGCSEVMRGKEQLRQHGQRHSVAKELTLVAWRRCSDDGCFHDDEEQQVHYHCAQNGCEHVSPGDQADMQRLQHVETSHYQVILKRTHDEPHHFHQSQSTIPLPSIPSDAMSSTCNLPSPLPSNNLLDSATTISRPSEMKIQSTTTSSCKYKKLEQNHEVEAESTSAQLLPQSANHRTNRFAAGQCMRIFCNLKKTEHYHCPLCDVGCSKRELYVRHCRRHK